jgi:hypothetical protein
MRLPSLYILAAALTLGMAGTPLAQESRDDKIAKLRKHISDLFDAQAEKRHMYSTLAVDFQAFRERITSGSYSITDESKAATDLGSRAASLEAYYTELGAVLVVRDKEGEAAQRDDVLTRAHACVEADAACKTFRLTCLYRNKERAAAVAATMFQHMDAFKSEYAP